MAQYFKRTTTTTRHEYVMPDPVNHAEFNKAMSLAEQELLATGRSIFDDTFHVTHNDDEVIIYWEAQA